MKNRLEVARELLRDDGVIFVQIDDNEQAYLKVLMDEIFGRDNFIQSISLKVNESKGLKNAHIEKKMPKNKEYILIFENKEDSFIFNPIKIKKSNEEFANYSKYYNKIIINKHEDINNWKITNFKGADKTNFLDSLIYMVKPDNELKIKIDSNKFINVVNQKGKENIYYNDGKTILKVLFLSENTHKYLGDIWVDISTININKESGVDTLSNAQKPESLLQRIIEISTKEGDLVLDFFAGSGTTLAVAHKMRRQYIGIEQMDYIKDITAKRLQKVIAGEQGGISKAVNWQGGGNFKFLDWSKNEKV